MISFIRKNIHIQFFKKDIKPLGRWSLVYDEKLNRKGDLSNEDHCAPCGTYALQQQEKNIAKMRVFTRFNTTYVPGYKTFDDYIDYLENK